MGFGSEFKENLGAYGKVSSFAKLGEGPIQCVVTGKEICRFTKFNPATNKRELTTKGDVDGQFRFAVNIVTKVGEKWVAQILEGSQKLYTEMVKELAKHNVEKTVFSLSQTGSKKSTTYHVIPVGQLSDEDAGKVYATEAAKLPAWATGSGTDATGKDLPF